MPFCVPRALQGGAALSDRSISSTGKSVFLLTPPTSMGSSRLRAYHRARRSFIPFSIICLAPSLHLTFYSWFPIAKGFAKSRVRRFLPFAIFLTVRSRLHAQRHLDAFAKSHQLRIAVRLAECGRSSGGPTRFEPLAYRDSRIRVASSINGKKLSVAGARVPHLLLACCRSSASGRHRRGACSRRFPWFDESVIEPHRQRVAS